MMKLIVRSRDLIGLINNWEKKKTTTTATCIISSFYHIINGFDVDSHFMGSILFLFSLLSQSILSTARPRRQCGVKRNGTQTFKSSEMVHDRKITVLFAFPMKLAATAWPVVCVCFACCFSLDRWENDANFLPYKKTRIYATGTNCSTSLDQMASNDRTNVFAM